MTSSPSGQSLRPLLAPRSIAFVGASARPNTPGNDMMRMIRRGGFTGTVHGVNPNAREIEGYPCVPGLADLPEPPDLAVLSVRNERLEETLAGYVIMLLILIPYFAFRVLSEALGEGRLERMFFVAREPNETGSGA